MKQFNVLDRYLKLHQHYLLEASAGTGKTFSIQNIVVRLLIECLEDGKEPLTLDQILVVTFTRAATRDLLQRIRSTLEWVLHILTEWLNEDKAPADLPDYLACYIEQGSEFVQKAKKRLQQALFAFEQAQIFTIHGFCARMLQQYAMESDMGLHSISNNGEEPLPTTEIMRVIRDFFRTEIRIELYSPGQLALILKEDPDQKKLLKAIMSGHEFAEMDTCQQLYERFIEVMRDLKHSLQLNGKEILEDFQAQSGLYRNHKSGVTKAETLVKISRFTALFDQESWSLEDFDQLISDELVWVKALDPTLFKSRASVPSHLHYPEFTKLLKQHLQPIIEVASDFSILLARLARDCQQLLKYYQREEERLSPDDLLRKMHWALNQPGFAKQIQSIYRAAIIDEFQDTDPVQWDIFQRLYIDPFWPGYLYLVGDPKQSIYSFRQADIYTYLAAVHVLGPERCFSLDTNYRSQPTLVEALNTLFAREHIPDLIPLPKKNLSLSYQPVQASKMISHKDFQDGKGAVHFFIADGTHFKKAKLVDLENQVFFPFIAQEIDLLRKQGMDFRHFAVLVRDRYQALRLAEFFDRYKIPYLNQRGVSLAESTALLALIDILKAILHPHDLGCIKAALGSPLIGWTHENLKQASEVNTVLVQVQLLRHHLLIHGFPSFMQEFLESKWQSDDLSVLERLLMQEGGIDIYHDLQQIMDIIIGHQYKDWSSPEGLIPFLDLFQIWHDNEDGRVRRFQDPSKNGVKILTLHFSKGLEFDVVFALGLINRVGMREELIPVEREGKMVLSPLVENSEEYQYYCEENDAEKMRQLYVALTRPKHRLYIPAAIHLASENLKMGEASPIDLFLVRLGQSSLSYMELYEKIKNYKGDSLLHFIESVGQRHYISYSLHQELSYEKQKDQLLSDHLEAPKSIQIPGQSLFISSFSSLTYQVSSGKNEENFNPPHDFENMEKSIHTLPADSDTGILLHHILEKIPFPIFKSFDCSSQSAALICPFIQKTLFKSWQEVIESLIFNAIKAPLPIGQDLFCLADLLPYHMYREMPFLFAYQEDLHLEGLIHSQGLIKGIIDLIFTYQGKYYILDWKSNWLGNNRDAYQATHIQAAMLENQYFLQAQIYTEALKRYLKIVDPRPFEECFGGVIYAFLRGLTSQDNKGFYHFFPSEACLCQVE